VNSPTFFRWFRRVLALCVIVNVVFLLLDAIDGGLAAAFGNIIAIALCAVAIVAQTATIRRMDRERLASLQPHPDYSGPTPAVVAPAARATLNRAIGNSFSSIRCYLGYRRSWVENGDEESLEMMRNSVKHLTQPEYDAVKALGDEL
jgi:hypothetical protein